MKDSTDLVVLTVGFLVGAIICQHYTQHLSYAAKKTKASKAMPAAPAPNTPVDSKPSTPVVSNTTPTATVAGDHIYPIVGAPKSGGAGKNQGIHYASTGKAATSHRVDIQGWGGKTNLEATVWLTMPATCSDGGKNGVGIKFYGPNHTGSACCYCLAGLGVSGNLHFGGEGPHPTTNSNMKAAGNVGPVGGKKVGFKHIIWKAGANIHQETWVNTTGKWAKTGEFDRATCGNVKTSATPASNAEVEFRSDCADVVYHSSEVVEITPPANASKTAGPTPAAGADSSPSAGGKTTTVTKPVKGATPAKGGTSYTVTIA